MKKFLNKKNTKGFTLIETVVAVGLFSIVMMVALAIILSVVDNNKKVHSVNVVVDNLNFSIDSMVRDIKTGKYYRCGGTAGVLSVDTATTNCTNSSPKGIITLISTLYDKEKIVQYVYDADKIIKWSCIADTTSTIWNCLAGTPLDQSDLTSSEINIKDVTFNINPGVKGSIQPSVFLFIKGTSAINPTDASDFTIQTLISQRQLNI